MKTHHYLLLIIAFSIIIFSPSLTNYFSSDDWFHLKISQINSWQEFLNFFSFTETPQAAAFYRPLSTQTFFFIFNHAFNLNPFPFHLFSLIIFALNLYLIYIFSLYLTKKPRQSLILVFLYSISVTHFSHLYFLSAFQETSLIFFSLLTLILHQKKSSPKNQLLSLLFFICALLSKETAVIIPLLLIASDWFQKKLDIKKTLTYWTILLPYLYLRLIVFGVTSGDSYLWSLSPSKILNTLIWYLLWSIGAPETLVDYVGSGFSLLPRFFSDFGFWSHLIILLLFGNLIVFTYLIIKDLRKINRIMVLSIIFFLISLLPVLFLPWHKFNLELGLALIGFCLFLSQLLKNKNTSTVVTALSFFLVLNLSMNYFTYTRHYAVNRSQVAKKITHYFTEKYPHYPENSYFEFINDTPDFGSTWGASKQISHITSNSNLFQVIYKNPQITIYFADYPGERPINKHKIEISTQQFFR